MISRRDLLKTGALAGGALTLDNSAEPSFAASLSSSTARPDEPRRVFSLLDDFVTHRMKELNAPGLTLVLSDRNGIIRTSTYGQADVKLNLGVRSETLFEIGSISKSFAALALLQLRDEDKVDLHRPIAQYLPWLQIDTQSEPITPHHLLSHTAGLPHDAPFFPRGSFGGKLWTGFRPGTNFSYSNVGYRILGILLEHLEGKKFCEILARRVFAPLGMVATRGVISSDIRPLLAVSYVPYFPDRSYLVTRKLAEAPFVQFDSAAGCIASTAGDMGRYLQMLLNRGSGPHGRLVSEESYDLLVTPVKSSPEFGEHTAYGYGLMIDNDDARTVLHHTGGMVGFVSSMHVDITNGVACFASVNASMQGYRPNDIVLYALELLRANKSKQKLPAPKSISTDVKDADEYVGEYATTDGKEFKISANDGNLFYASNGRRTRLLRQDTDRFALLDSESSPFSVYFLRDQGRVVEALQGPEWFTNDRYSGPREFKFPREWQAYAGRYYNDSPWLGFEHVFLHKGKLWLNNSTPLVPLDDVLFRAGTDASSPERVSFDARTATSSIRMNFSGVDFERADIDACLGKFPTHQANSA